MGLVCFLALLAPGDALPSYFRPGLMPNGPLPGYGPMLSATVSGMSATAAWQTSPSAAEELRRQWKRAFAQPSEAPPQAGPAPQSPMHFPWLGLSPSSDALWPAGYEVIASRKLTRATRPAVGCISCGTGLEECEWGIEEAEEGWVKWLSRGRPANRLWFGLPSADVIGVGKRVQSILASDRPGRHKREEIAGLIQPGMTVQEVHFLLGPQEATTFALLGTTVCFNLEIAIDYTAGIVRRVREKAWGPEPPPEPETGFGVAISTGRD
jgi:hypothetical protein